MQSHCSVCCPRSSRSVICSSKAGVSPSFISTVPIKHKGMFGGLRGRWGPGGKQLSLLESRMETLSSPVSPLLVPLLHHSPQTGRED